MKKRPVKTVFLISLVLVTVFFGIPLIAYMLGWRPPQTGSISYKNSELGVRIRHSFPEDRSDWEWREKPMSGGKGGIFFEMRHVKSKAYIAFAFMPLPEETFRSWLENNRRNSGKYSNMKYSVFETGKERWTEEIADYVHEDIKLRYYTVGHTHKRRLIFIESCVSPGSFDSMLPSFKKIIASTELFE